MGATDYARLSCLIVEDEHQIRGVMERAMGELGIRCDSVDTIASATSSINQVSYDLVVLDKNLPDGSGFDLSQQLVDADCAVVLCTGEADLGLIAQAVRHRIDDLVPKPFAFDELQNRIAGVIETLQIRRSQARVIEELKKQNEILRKVAGTDSLTGLCSFHDLRARIDQEVSSGLRHQRNLALAVLDVEGFRELNRCEGHEAGDQLLKEIAGILRGDELEQAILRHEDVVARSGPDEFAILLPDTEAQEAMRMMTRLHQAITSKVSLLGHPVSIAVGIAGFPEDATRASELITAAGLALAAAKEPEAARTMLYDSKLAGRGANRRSAALDYARRATALEESMRKQLFSYAYQPIVRAKDRSIVGYEALVRPKHERLRNPLHLFESAERSGCIRELNRILRRVCVEPVADLAEPQYLFMNLHPTDLYDPELLAGEDFLTPWADRIVLEVTEVAEIKSFEKARQSLDILRDRGFKVAVDDFGAGYSGLNNLALLNPDFVKIDMALVRQVDKNPRLARLIRHIIDFANAEYIQVIAEGVETEDECNTVCELGAKLVQGYYFAKPAPPFATL